MESVPGSPVRSKIPGVVQAAGLSRRMEGLGSKLLLPYRDRPLIAHVVDAALASRLSEVVVVVGPAPGRMRSALPGDPRVRVAQNARYALGRSESIRIGVERTPPTAPGVIFLLGDQPLMTPEMIDAVIEAAEAEAAKGPAGADLVVPEWNGAKGNPVYFARGLFGELGALSGDHGAFELIASMWDRCVRVPVVEPRTQVRIETPGDYKRLQDDWPEGSSWS